METNPFSPTHAITFANGDVLKVQLVDGVAYTREEWNSYSHADWTVSDEGEWLFQGRAIDGSSVERLT